MLLKTITTIKPELLIARLTWQTMVTTTIIPNFPWFYECCTQPLKVERISLVPVPTMNYSSLSLYLLLLLTEIKSVSTKVYLGPCQISIMKFFDENSSYLTSSLFWKLACIKIFTNLHPHGKKLIIFTGTELEHNSFLLFSAARITNLITWKSFYYSNF